jgi:hypothetical protein
MPTAATLHQLDAATLIMSRELTESRLKRAFTDMLGDFFRGERLR